MEPFKSVAELAEVIKSHSGNARVLRGAKCNDITIEFIVIEKSAPWSEKRKAAYLRAAAKRHIQGKE
jgi:hypothetical protein